jgi:hypothetical protein
VEIRLQKLIKMFGRKSLFSRCFISFHRLPRRGRRAIADYDLVSSAQMLQYKERAVACDAAIRMAVTPGSVVLELGTGAEFMARLACRHAASHVLWVRIALLCLL